MIFITKVLCCFSIYWLTYHLNNTRNWGGIKASAFVAILIGTAYQFCIEFDLKLTLLRDYFSIMMGATFMGMIANHHQHKKIDFIISALIFCTLFQHSSSFFNGFGGLLGTIACISILCVFGIERILVKLNK